MLPPIPAPLTRFFGRDPELAQINAWLSAGHRLITICGPPGVGKSRLAAELVRSVRGAWGRVLWLDFTAAQTSAEAVEVLASATQLRLPAAASPDQVSAALAASPRTLFVADNFERLAQPCAAALASWVTGAPQNRWIVTSRLRLGVAGEHVLELGPFSCDADGPGVALLLARASEDPEAAAALAAAPASLRTALVEQVDGLPMGIELIAFALDTLDPAEVLSRLKARKPLGGLPGMDSRYRTLDQAIAWSWSILGEDARSALAQCAVFRGPFDVADADAVIEVTGRATVDLLRVLKRASMVSTVLGPPRRLQVLASIRDHGASAMPEVVSACRRRFADHFAARAQGWVRDDWEEQTAERRAEILRQRAHLEAALGPATADARMWILLALDLALYPLGQLRSLREHFAHWVRALPAQPHPDEHIALLTALRVTPPGVDRETHQLAHRLARERACDNPEVAAFEAQLLWKGGDRRGARAALDRAEPLAALPRRMRSLALGVRAAMDHEAGDDNAVELYEAALRAALEDGQAIQRAVMLTNFGRLLRRKGYFARAAGPFAEAAQTLRDFGVLRLEARAQGELGYLHLSAGRHAEALAAAERETELGVRGIHADVVASGQAQYALTYADTGRYSEGLEAAGAALRAIQSVQQPGIRGDIYHVAAQVAWVGGHVDDAVRYARAAEALAVEGLGAQWSTHIRSCLAGVLAASGEMEEAQQVSAAVDLQTLDADRSLWLFCQLMRAHVNLDAAGDWLKEALGAAWGERWQVRFAVRTLRRRLPDQRFDAWLLDARDPNRNALFVSAEAERVQTPGGTSVDLSTRQKLRSLLLTLVAHAQTGQPPLQMVDLAAAIWPGEALVGNSGRQRVYQSVLMLRKACLGDLLVKDAEGYRLDPEVPVLWSANFR